MSTFIVVTAALGGEDVIINTDAVASVREHLEPDGETKTTVFGMIGGEKIAALANFQAVTGALQAARIRR